MDDEATQLTQGVYDPRRQGRNNSGLSSTDVADVLCILHPCSPAAFHVVTKTAIRSPQHVLQNNGSGFFDGDLSQKPTEEQETFILDQDRHPSERRNLSYDLALRFSARTVNPGNGFLFGRNAALSDIVLDTDSTKRVSNTHFRVYVNDQGVLMLQDLSTNGTLVDETHLKGKASRLPQTRMLNPGSIIQILTAKDEELVKFIVRIPSRDGHVDEYRDRLQAYMEKVAVANAKAQAARQGQVMQHLPAPVAPGTGPNGRGTSSSTRMSLWPNKYGMRWDGGAKYNPAGLLGKGAFATVYMLATKSEGQLFAVKELEKRRFMKNGILDRKLDNEMQIMKGISHPNIVQYVEYEETTTDLYIIMEFVPYGDLQQYLGEKGPLPEDLAKTMAQQVFDAMTYLHNKRITHRDIKPDNILIANDDPNDFQVKLSDFGLSKVVKDNETFLKTFCGTLLYCAPEVFPHYDAHQASKGQKRTRRGTPQSAKYHSYSQSVDVWSFGAVLWFALCTSPPFEGVADNTGRGMFEKIMLTALDPRPLLQQGVSHEAISLLQDMLNTDPSERPSPAQCLRYAWFGDRTSAVVEEQLDLGLNTINEEDEVEGGAEPDMSQLSINERANGDESPSQEVDIGSDEFDFLDPRQSKRFRTASFAAYRDPSEILDSSPDRSRDVARSASVPASVPQPDAGQVGRRLFGEIGQSALESSGVFGVYAKDDPLLARVLGESAKGQSVSAAPGEELFATAVSHQPTASGNQEPDRPRPDSFTVPPSGDLEMVGGSLLGAESHFRDLNMESPQSANSPAGDLSEPTTPRTPEQPPQPSLGQADGAIEETPTRAQEETPKPRTFSRQISLPVHPSLFFDPHDPTTHTLEYAKSVSGLDFNDNASHTAEDYPSLPATMAASASTSGASPAGPAVATTPDAAPAPGPTLEPAPEFIRPPPHLGRLTTTADSFTPITINLSSRITTWGRAPSNTVPYPDGYDTRIPKRGIVLFYHAAGIEDADARGEDWTKMKGLHCLLVTHSSVGISVNGVRLCDKDEKGRQLYGRVHSGDEICVWQGRDREGKTSELKFVCEFYHGEGAERRKEGTERFRVLTDEGGAGAGTSTSAAER